MPETPSYTSSIENFYNHGYNEWERLEHHRTEFAVTMQALLDHLPPAPALLLDCGGGPGRYAIELAQRGYQVVLFDLSARNLQVGQQKAAEAGVVLAGYEQGNALDLSRFGEQAFDAVLMLGPLYHLLEEAHRRQALEEALRVLRPGGRIFASFISRFAAHRDMLGRAPLELVEDPTLSDQILASGLLLARGKQQVEFVAYLAHPTELAPLFWTSGYAVLAVLGVEGLASLIENEINALQGEAWQAWVDLNYQVAADPSLHGGVEHLLVVAEKPAWKPVLAELARVLDQAGVFYKVIGSAAAALQGVPLQVKDLDIETDQAGAYRIQELFARHVLEPVEFSAFGDSLSHFTRLDFNGVQVDVLGDPHRQEAGEWKPGSCQTEIVIDMDGTLVLAACLEEQTLNYMRRGRLQRAGLCLPHCDAGRLAGLLRTM